MARNNQIILIDLDKIGEMEKEDGRAREVGRKRKEKSSLRELIGRRRLKNPSMPRCRQTSRCFDNKIFARNNPGAEGNCVVDRIFSVG